MSNTTPSTSFLYDAFIGITYLSSLLLIINSCIYFLTGVIYPTTNLGRIIAVILMIIGLGFVGMLSGTIATYFLSQKKIKNFYRSSVLEDIKDKLDNFDDLSSDELDDICLVLKSLKSSQTID